MNNSIPEFKLGVRALGNDPVPVEGYLSPEIFRLEIKHDIPALIVSGLLDDLIGQIVTGVGNFNTSVLVTCDSGSNIYAPHNICGHCYHRVTLEKG